MKNNFNFLKELTLVLIIIGVFYFFQLDSRPLNNPDEGRYSSVAYEMILNKNYVTPTVIGSTFFDKPPMHYWLQISTFKIFGINAWSIRFWPTLLGILTILFSYIVAKKVFNTKVALFSISILATTPLFYFATKYANTDLEIASFISLTLFSFLLGYKFYYHKYGKYFYFLAYAFAGVGFLTKGLIALVFPAIIIGLWVIIFKKWSLILQMKPWWGILIIGVIISPWLYLISKAHPDFLEYFFIYQQFSRFLSIDKFNNAMPIWFYIAIIIGGFWGWSVLFFMAFKNISKNIKIKTQNYEYLVFFIIWFLFILIFFSIPKTKLVGYILPVFPPIAILLGYTCYTIFSKNNFIKVIASIQYMLLVGFLISLFFIVKNPNLWLSSNLFYPYFLLPLVLLLGLPLLYLYYKKASFVPYFIYITLTSVLLLLAVNNCSKYIYIKPPTTKPLCDVLKTSLSHDSKVIMFNSYLPDITLYIKRPVYYVNDWKYFYLKPCEDSDESRIAKYCYDINNYKCPYILDYSTLHNMWDKEKPIYIILKNKHLDYFKKYIGNYTIISSTPSLKLIKNEF